MGYSYCALSMGVNDEDRVKCIEKLIKAKETTGFKLYGYFIMDNHVHILIEEQERNDLWGFGKYEKDGVPIQSMTYFKLNARP